MTLWLKLYSLKMCIIAVNLWHQHFIISQSLLAKSRKPIANVIIRVGFEEEVGGCNTYPYLTTDLSFYLASLSKAFKNAKQTQNASDIFNDYQASRSTFNFRSETMRASSLCLVFGLVLLMAWSSEAQRKFSWSIVLLLTKLSCIWTYRPL